MNASKAIDASETIEQNESKTNKSGISKQFITFIDTYLKNLPTPSRTTQFGINNAKQIFISTTDQLTGTNRTRMGHLLLLEKTVCLKDLAIICARLVENLIIYANQAIASIDRLGHGDQELTLGSSNIGNKMSVDFGRNADDKIRVNPSRTIGIPRPQIIRTRIINCNIFESVIRMFYLSYGVLPWLGTTKSESENLRGKKISKILSAK